MSLVNVPESELRANSKTKDGPSWQPGASASLHESLSGSRCRSLDGEVFSWRGLHLPASCELEHAAAKRHSGRRQVCR